jgi:hypothetical protein
MRRSSVRRHQRTAYRALAFLNDLLAVQAGPKAIARRAGRRAYGRSTGRLARRLFG